MKRKHKDFETGDDARSTLITYLSRYHPFYTIDDVYLSNVRGYLKTTKKCFCRQPPFDGSWMFFPTDGHYHTIRIIGVCSKDKRYPYQLWDALKKFDVLPEKGVKKDDSNDKS